METNKISDFTLEQYLLNELPFNVKKEIDGQLVESRELKERLQALKNSNEEILRAFPEHEMSEIIQKKLTVKTKKSFNFLPFALPALTVALAVFFIIILPNIKNQHSRTDIKPPNNNRIKGPVALKGEKTEILLFRKKGKTVEHLKNKSLAYEGELIQLAYKSTGSKYGIIFSIDGDGTLTLHYPEEMDKSTKLIQNQIHYLNYSYELDDAPEFERFYLISSPEDIDIGKLFDKIIFDKARVLEDKLDLKKINSSFLVSSIIILKGKKK